MDVFEAVKTRRSVRRYRPDPIPEDTLAKILGAARLAPSAWNNQPWKFIVVKDEEQRTAVAMRCPSKTRDQLFIAEAPVVLVAVATDTSRVMSNGLVSWPIDMAIVIDHLTLLAASEGLGTCWIGTFQQEDLKSLLGIPSDMMIAAVMPLGYPADEPKTKVRKELDEIVCYDAFS